MSWENVDLRDVKPGWDTVAEGDYTYIILPGTKLGQYGDLQVPVSIVSEGEFNGRRLFLSYPDPTGDPVKFGWSSKALKCLEVAIGLEQDVDAGETKVEWLNRAGAAFAKFASPVTHRKKTNKAGEEITVADVSLFKVRPAA